MRKLKSTKVWIPAILLAGLLAGCGDPDANSGAGKPGSPLTPPAVTSVNPLNGSTFTCGNPVVINATFSKAMNPATINTTTFTLATGSTSVVGVVTYSVATNVATFTPSAPLTPNSLFVATITTGAQDQFGNGLTSNFFWSFTSSPQCPPPTVTAVTPPNGNVGVCPNTALITATFSHAMNPATINTTTFTLTGTGGASVAGAVTYAAATNIATFTPSASLAQNTKFTATITTGAQDISLNPLAANFVWMFTTSATCAPPSPVPLGTAGNFKVLAGSTVTNTGPTTIAGGNLGLSPGSSVTGFPPGTLVAPAVMHVTDPTAAQAQLDLTTAYNFAAAIVLPAPAVLPGDLSGLTLTAGTYKTSSSTGITAGTVTLKGSATDVFVFQIGSTLTTGTGTQVVLSGGVVASNVFWQVGSSATLGTGSSFAGTIMALTSITLDPSASLQGRALARNGAVTLDANVITDP
jgi:hypothetical protein